MTEGWGGDTSDDQWPSRYEVADELRRRNPERYGSMVNFSYTPGDGPPATLEQVADMVEHAGDEAAHPILGIACRLGGMAFLMEDASKTRTDVRTMKQAPDPPHYRTYREAAALMRQAEAKLRDLASADTLPKGQDAKQGLAGTEGGAVDAEGSETPND